MSVKDIARISCSNLFNSLILEIIPVRLGLCTRFFITNCRLSKILLMSWGVCSGFSSIDCKRCLPSLVCVLLNFWKNDTKLSIDVILLSRLD